MFCLCLLLLCFRLWSNGKGCSVFGVHGIIFKIGIATKLESGERLDFLFVWLFFLILRSKVEMDLFCSTVGIFCWLSRTVTKLLGTVMWWHDADSCSWSILLTRSRLLDDNIDGILSSSSIWDLIILTKQGQIFSLSDAEWYWDFLHLHNSSTLADLRSCSSSITEILLFSLLSYK